MPFSVDASSLLEQGLVEMLHGGSARHMQRSVQAVVAGLMHDVGERSSSAPDQALPRRSGAQGNTQTTDVSAAAFEALMASELGWFEGGERVRGVIDDHQLTALARMHAVALAELSARHSQSWVDRTPFSAAEAVVMEVATATGLAPGTVSLRLELATGAPSRTAFLRSQVRDGSTPLWRACEIVRETRVLDDDVADGVARTVLAPTRDGAGLSNGLFRRRLRRALLAADHDQAARRRSARERIGAHAQVYDDGTGCITVVNDADKIAAAMDRADAAARAARGAGDSRSLDELRADFLTGAAVQGWPDDPGFARTSTVPAARVFVVVPFTTAVGLDDAPCELPGHGWVAAQQAREIMTAPGSVWQTLVADVDTGKAVALSRKAYRPSREMVEHVRAVDGVCRGPGCLVEARQCDLDHDIPWPVGPTQVSNFTDKHRQHHRVRTAGWWQAHRDESARVTWRTAAGRTYVTLPKDWFDGLRPDDLSPPPASTLPPPRAPTPPPQTPPAPTPVPPDFDPDPPPF
jgi:hypothetical protein